MLGSVSFKMAFFPSNIALSKYSQYPRSATATNISLKSLPCSKWKCLKNEPRATYEIASSYLRDQSSVSAKLVRRKKPEPRSLPRPSFPHFLRCCCPLIFLPGKVPFKRTSQSLRWSATLISVQGKYSRIKIRVICSPQDHHSFFSFSYSLPTADRPLRLLTAFSQPEGTLFSSLVNS